MCYRSSKVNNKDLVNDIIFLGELSSAVYHENIKINDENSFPAEVDSFFVIKVWKGPIKENQKVAIHQFGIGCTYTMTDYVPGTKMIIGAHKKPDSGDLIGIGRFWTTSLCGMVFPKFNRLPYWEGIEFLDEHLKPKEKPLLSRLDLLLLVLATFLVLLVPMLFQISMVGRI